MNYTFKDNLHLDNEQKYLNQLKLELDNSCEIHSLACIYNNIQQNIPINIIIKDDSITINNENIGLHSRKIYIKLKHHLKLN